MDFLDLRFFCCSERRMLIRFKKNDGTEYPQWEEKRLGNISEIYQPQTISKSECTGGEYPVYGANGLIGYYNKYNHNKEQVTIGCRGSCGKVNLVPAKSWITGNSMVINVDKNNINKKYLYELLSSQNLNYMVCGSGQPQITREPCMNHKVYIPCLEEQQKIADFLSTVDHKIETQKSIVADYEELKKGIMQKIFNQEIRFKDNKGNEFPAWERKQLRDITEEIKRKADIDSIAPIMMISQGKGFIYQSEKYSRENAGQSLAKYTLLKRGEMAYNHGASKAKPYGVTYCLNEEDEARVPFVYHSYKIIDGIINYWNYALNSSLIDRQLKKIVSSGARMDGLLNISYDNYMKIQIDVPCLKEQKKIANCLSALDRKIEAEKKILADLEELKKGLLQGIFNN